MFQPAKTPHVLFIRLSALGDVVHTLPAASKIKERVPGAAISWVVEAPSVDLLVGNPVVDKVIVFPKQALKKAFKSPAGWGVGASELRGFLENLRRDHYDLTIDFQGLLKSALIGFASGATQRLGFAQARELAPSLYTHKLADGDYFGFDVHVVEHNLNLAREGLRILGEPSEVSPDETTFSLPAPDRAAVEAFRLRLDGQGSGENSGSSGGSDTDRGASPGVGSEQIFEVTPDDVTPVQQVLHGLSLESLSGKRIALIPGTTWSSKIWKPERWISLAEKLLGIHNVRIVIVGGPGEVDINRSIFQKIQQRCSPGRIEDLTGSTTLLDLVALFHSIDIVIGADTGPLHLATAVGVEKVFGIFGSTPPGRNGPWGPTGQAISLGLSCQPCFKKVCPLSTLACLEDMEADFVFSEIVQASP